MRLTSPIRAALLQHNHHVGSRFFRAISTGSEPARSPELATASDTATAKSTTVPGSETSQAAQDYNFEAIKRTLQLRKPKFIYDELSSTPSNLLSIALTDHIPADLYPRGFTPKTNYIKATYEDARLPRGHHLVYFPFQGPASELAPDGADRDHSPGAPFVRRMWAGGTITFSRNVRNALRIGENAPRAVCVEEIGDVQLKNADVAGSEKVFVDVHRTYYPQHKMPFTEIEKQRIDAISIAEKRTLVFMKAQIPGKPGAPKSTPKTDRVDVSDKLPQATLSFSLTPDPFLLFHFSALTYNAHFIHYDQKWVEAEGYPGLLVHGPLTLVLMLSALRSVLRKIDSEVAHFEYRNLAPLYSGEKMTICVMETKTQRESLSAKMKSWSVWVLNSSGRVHVKATALSAPLMLTDDEKEQLASAREADAGIKLEETRILQKVREVEEERFQRVKKGKSPLMYAL